MLTTIALPADTQTGTNELILANDWRQDVMQENAAADADAEKESRQNLLPVEVVCTKTGRPHILYVVGQDTVPRGAELLIDYGNQYWKEFRQRQKREDVLAAKDAALAQERKLRRELLRRIEQLKAERDGSAHADMSVEDAAAGVGEDGGGGEAEGQTEGEEQSVDEDEEPQQPEQRQDEMGGVEASAQRDAAPLQPTPTREIETAEGGAGAAGSAQQQPTLRSFFKPGSANSRGDGTPPGPPPALEPAQASAGAAPSEAGSAAPRSSRLEARSRQGPAAGPELVGATVEICKCRTSRICQSWRSQTSKTTRCAAQTGWR